MLYDEYQDNSEDIKCADIILVCLNFGEFYANLSNDVLTGKATFEAIENDCIHKCRELYTYIKNSSNARVIWFGFEDYYFYQSKNYGTLLPFNGLVDKLNLTLNNMCREDAFIDLKRLIATVGINNAYDNKGKYRWNSPYSKELIALMANEVYAQHLIATGSTKKCLILDCDNVLWGGILSEEGIEGIIIGNSGLGRPFQDFQRYLLDLYYHGVILAVCSKNDKSDVVHVFQEHTGMLLKEEHITCFRCNWDNKPDNIRYIARALNIGLDSIVFIDDSVFEVESVRAMIPEVTTILYQRDTVYDELSCFKLKHISDFRTIKERTSTYKTNEQRAELQRNASSFDEYISSLEMVVDIHRTQNHELARVSELTQRTNKCTNGVRYTIDQIQGISKSGDYQLYTVCLRDKFSDFGIVGVMGIQEQGVDLFSLSCRALGRMVEDKMIDWLLEKDVTTIRFKLTNSNESLCNLLKHYGLCLVDTRVAFGLTHAV